MAESIKLGGHSCIHEVHQYIPCSPTPEAHTLETWASAKPSASGGKRYWIIYIHGGAWWRPMITASSFSLTVQHLLSSPNSEPYIAGYASINYRLSTPPPLPQFSQFVEPDNLARNVKHPAHLDDVVAAIKYLQKTFGFAENYILAGHSCGATLAFQISSEAGLAPPAGVLGVEGIYDLMKLRDDHKDIPMYQYFTESAFGSDESAWSLASPTTQKSEFLYVWEKAKVVALAQSDEDELVDVSQKEVMWEKILGRPVEGRKDVAIRLTGKHDEIWREGERETQLKVAIEQVLKLVSAE
ncbi:Alpha/Beta hydrolase protein [Rhexocercosporidium sp. MPI-PUGE-AT-0058]|nr:Alpha/Beta hydrolase protein [Rhexocercosporidium sp. MPI-PUGE-AT-0058]